MICYKQLKLDSVVTGGVARRGGVWRRYLLAKALSQPALPESNGQACAVEDPQGAGDSQHMPARLGVITMA